MIVIHIYNEYFHKYMYILFNLIEGLKFQNVAKMKFQEIESAVFAKELRRSTTIPKVQEKDFSIPAIKSPPSPIQ